MALFVSNLTIIDIEIAVFAFIDIQDVFQNSL